MINFYEVDSNYINFLKTIDKQIPNIEYSSRNKFVCGIVLNINTHKYYAPISHFNRQQATNFIICDNFGKPISSIRFCFMFPALPQVLTQINIQNYLQGQNVQNRKYGYLMHIEHQYCQRNIMKIQNRCIQTYKIGINPNHKLNYTCCDFSLLEANYLNYNPNIQYSTIQN